MQTDKEDVKAINTKKEAEKKRDALAESYSNIALALLNHIHILDNYVYNGSNYDGSNDSNNEKDNENVSKNMLEKDNVKEEKEEEKETNNHDNDNNNSEIEIKVETIAETKNENIIDFKNENEIKSMKSNLSINRNNLIKEYQQICKKLSLWEDINNEKYFLIFIGKL